MAFTHPSCLSKLILRYLLRRHINIFAVLAVFLSIACLFTVNAVFKGFDKELQSLFRGSLADVLVEWRWNKPPISLIDEALKDYSPAPALESFGMIRTTSHVTAINFKGVDPSKEQRLREAMGLSSIDFLKLDQMAETQSPLGGFLDMLGEAEGDSHRPMIIGSVLADHLGMTIGDQLQLISPNWKEQVSQRSFTIVDIFHSGYYEDDSSKVYIHIHDARDLQQYPGGYSVIQLALGQKNGLSKLESFMEDKFPESMVSTWKDRHGQRMRAIAHERKLIVIVLSMIVIVASFGILALQWSFVKEKTRDIGILRAMGFSKKDIFAIFLGVSWMVGITGLVLGLCGGVLISHYANDIISITGWRPFPGDLYYHEKLPVSLEWGDALWITILSLSVTTCAGLFPAWKATNVDPVEAIAYE
jgi:lipoprotein-releasing system permease protein